MALALVCSDQARGDGEALLTSGKRLADVAVIECRFDSESHQATLRVEGLPHETEELVRWGEPVAPNDRVAVTLADGSRLSTDRPWSPTGLVRIDAETVRLRRGKKWIEFPRDRVRGVTLLQEADAAELDRIAEEADGDDVVLLTGGDRIAGRVEELSSDTLTIAVAGESIEASLESVVALRLHGAPQVAAPAVCLVGLNDGSLLHVDRLVVGEDRFELDSNGAHLEGAAEGLSFVQPLGAATYLSDLEPIDYRHTPYLDLPWPLARDRGMRGGQLIGGGRRAAKGLAIHSAARVVYRLDGSLQRFQADLAVADPAPGATAQGSVVFRVYLVRDGKFESAYESPIVRGGDPALSIDINTVAAAGLALVVDYADDGDAGDDALWLDARLTRHK